MFSTGGMAEDAICLLDYIGWTKKRDIHIVGISLGGMIAQGMCIMFNTELSAEATAELATRIPERIASLTLAVTTPGGPIYGNFPPVSAASYPLILPSLYRLSGPV